MAGKDRDRKPGISGKEHVGRRDIRNTGWYSHRGDGTGKLLTCWRILNSEWEQGNYFVKAEAGDSQKEYLEEEFQGIEMYVAYKSEQWLSVEYSFQVEEPGVWEPYGDGILDFGVTVDMQTGERVMVDDLFEMQGFIEWRSTNMGNMDELRLQKRVERAIMSEREFIESQYGAEKDINSVLKHMLSIETNTNIHSDRRRLECIKKD